MSERRSDKTLLKLDAVEFRTTMYALKREDPERVERLRLERRRLRQRRYDLDNPEAVKAKKRRTWQAMKERDPDFLARHAEAERKRYADRKGKA